MIRTALSKFRIQQSRKRGCSQKEKGLKSMEQFDLDATYLLSIYDIESVIL